MNAPTATRTETEIESLRHDVTLWLTRNPDRAIRAEFDTALAALPTEAEVICGKTFRIIPDDVQMTFFTKWHTKLDGIIPMKDKHHA